MNLIGKKSKIKRLFGRCLRMLLILGSIVICIEGCSKDDENKENDPPQKEAPIIDGLHNREQDTLIISQAHLSNVEP